MQQLIRKIGNSQGIILPRPLLQQVGIEEAVEIEVLNGTIILRPVRKHPRAGWDETFQKAISDGHEPEGNLLEGLTNTFDETDWTW